MKAHSRWLWGRTLQSEVLQKERIWLVCERHLKQLSATGQNEWGRGDEVGEVARAHQEPTLGYRTHCIEFVWSQGLNCFDWEGGWCVFWLSCIGLTIGQKERLLGNELGLLQRAGWEKMAALEAWNRTLHLCSNTSENDISCSQISHFWFYMLYKANGRNQGSVNWKQYCTLFMYVNFMFPKATSQ